MSILDKIPKELLELICIRLSIRDIVHCLQTSTLFESLDSPDFIISKTNHDFRHANSISTIYVNIQPNDYKLPINIYKRFKQGHIYGLYKAVRNGHLDVVTWKLNEKREFGQNIGNVNDIYKCTLNKPIELIQLLIKYGLKPNSLIASLAAVEGRTDILTLLAQHNIFPDNLCEFHINKQNNKSMLLQGYSNIKFTEGYAGYYKDIITINTADISIYNQQYHMLPILAQRGILPTQCGADIAVADCEIEILDWLFNLGILPSIPGCDLFSKYSFDINRKVATLKWLCNHDRYPSNVCADAAMENGDTTLLHILYEYNIVPSLRGANYALCHNDIQSLDWLAQHNIFPDINTDFVRSKFNHLQTSTLDWLNAHGFKFNNFFLESSIRDNIEANVIWFLQNGVTIKQKQCINDAITYGYINILNILAQYGILPEHNPNVVKNIVYKQFWPILEFLDKHERLPITVLDSSYIHFTVDKLEWMHERGIHVGYDAVYSYLVAGLLEQTKWFLDHNRVMVNHTLLRDVISNGHIDILNLLFEHNCITDQIIVCKVSKIEILQLFHTHNKLHNLNCIDTAMGNNQDTILVWLLQHEVKPSIEAIRIAFMEGEEQIIHSLLKFGILPDLQCINGLVAKGRNHVLTLFGKIFFTQAYVELACSEELTHVLSWLAKNRVVPNREVIIKSVKSHYMTVLQWMVREMIIEPRNIADIAVSLENYEFLEWLRMNKIYPNTKTCTLAKQSASQKMKMWLQQCGL